MKSFFGGIFGGLIIIGIFIITLCFYNPFYYSIHLVNPNMITDYKDFKACDKQIENMERMGIIMTPQDYTNNISRHYNTTITILVAMLVIFSVIGYLHLRFASQQQVFDSVKKNLKDSRELRDIIFKTIFGKADEKFVKLEEYTSLSQKVEELENRLSNINTERSEEEIE